MSRILVIDDDRGVTSVLKRGLTYEGYTVNTADSGYEGLTIARDHVPDLVILDLMLPGLDGFGVLEPYLPRNFLEALAPYRQYSIVVLFILAWQAPWFGDLVFGNARTLLEFVGDDTALSSISRFGADLFRFWER